MLLSCDAVTGFPWVDIQGAGIRMPLLPVSRVEFERFLAEQNSFGDRWYDAVLAVAPRASWRTAGQCERHQLLMTGIAPEEALAYTAWLGRGYDLPTFNEWQVAVAYLSGIPFEKATLRAAPLCEPARAILGQILTEVRPRTWADVALFHGGIAEWVRWPGGSAAVPRYGGAGSPAGMVLAARIHQPILPTRDGRHPKFGFRPVRRGVEPVEDPWA